MNGSGLVQTLAMATSQGQKTIRLVGDIDIPEGGDMVDVIMLGADESALTVDMSARLGTATFSVPRYSPANTFLNTFFNNVMDAISNGTAMPRITQAIFTQWNLERTKNIQTIFSQNVVLVKRPGMKLSSIRTAEDTQVVVYTIKGVLRTVTND